jgi:hypothetical protein
MRRFSRADCCLVGIALAAAYVTAGAVNPGGALSAKLACVHPMVKGLPQRPAIVGVPWRWRGSTFWCLEASDRLANAAVSWGDGSSSPASVIYSEPSWTRLVKPQSPQGQAFVESAYIYGSHVYERPNQLAQITASATDEPSGTPLISRDTARVFSKDSGRPTAARARLGRGFHANVARVLAPSILASPDGLSATIIWGDGARLEGLVTPPVNASAPGVHAYTVSASSGHAPWRHVGIHHISVVVTDSVGPQKLVIHTRVLVIR